MHLRVGSELLVAAFDAHNTPRVGETIEIRIELGAVHLFDVTTEKRL